MRIPYSAVFLDTTTATGLRECFNPAHPTSRAQDLEWKQRQLGACSFDMSLVTGSETGADWALPFVHYFEGMMSLGLFRLPDSGYDLFSRKDPTPDFLRFQVSARYRVPLFELVYHDCVVNYWYWGDSSNRLEEFWDFRDLLNILYGTPPFWHVDEELWARHKERYLKSYRDVVSVAARVAGKAMLDFRYLSQDRMVQETEFEGGTKVRVNFGNKTFKVTVP